MSGPGILDRVFRIREAGSTVGRECLAGSTTFLAMAYIVVVNPAILSQAGMDFGAVFTATCLASALATIVMGLAANYPIALAPGMGQNLFFVSVVVGAGIAWPQALAAVFLSGVVFVALTLTRVRSLLIEAIPGSLKSGIGVGIGLLIALVGMRNAGLVRSGEGGIPRLGDPTSAPVGLALIGLVVTLALNVRGVRGALLWGIAASTGVAVATGRIVWNGAFAAPPSLTPTLLKMDLAGVLRWEAIPVVVVFLYMAMFDAIGTLVAVGERAGLMRGGRLLRSDRALLADASGTVAGALLGTSTVTAYVESAAGVEEGGRTGLANMVTAGLFLSALFVSPLAGMIGGGIGGEDGATYHPCTSAALLLVGALMARGVARIPWDDPTEAIPAFLVILGIPFTYSIGDGLALGFIAYPAIKILAGRGREAHWVVHLIGLLFLARYILID